MDPSHIYLISDKFYKTNFNIFSATVISLSKNLNKGLFMADLSFLALSIFLGKISMNLSTFSLKSLSHYN